MAIVRTGDGVTDIRGGFGGVYFTRDKSGLHCTAKPRRVKQRTTAQHRQRNAFSTARRFSKVNRTVSYYIYRTLTGLPLLEPPSVTGDVSPDCTGSYIYTGVYGGFPYYVRADSVYFLWWLEDISWNISTNLGIRVAPRWGKVGHPVDGDYIPLPPTTGIASVKINAVPVPIDYQPPHLREPRP